MILGMIRFGLIRCHTYLVQVRFVIMALSDLAFLAAF